MANVSAVRERITADPNEGDKIELAELLSRTEEGEAGTQAELDDWLSLLLQFGTAGLCGPMAAGPFRMNMVVVRKAVAGLSSYLRKKTDGDDFLVVGYDVHRNLRKFAEGTIAIATVAGLCMAILPRTLPTPILAYAMRTLGADAGVMVTVSYNPARDNGYKVYLGGMRTDKDGRGVQLVPPADAEIVQEVEATGPVTDTPLATDYATVGEELVDSYMAECATSIPIGPRDLRIVYTAMHGVGA